jgi:hypothetical protein
MNDKNSKLNEFLSGKKVSRYEKLRDSIARTSQTLANSNTARMLKNRLLFWRIPRYRKIIAETVPFTAFIVMACYVAYLMERHNDEIKRKIQYTQTLKQEQIEKEDQVLKNILKDPKNPNYNKQIREVQRYRKLANKVPV